MLNINTQVNPCAIEGVNIVLWGIVLMLQAIPNTFAPLFILRILLGDILNPPVLKIHH